MKTIQFILVWLGLASSLCASGFGFGSGNGTREVFVALTMEARVRGVDIAVGDIAEVTGGDAEAVKLVSELSLGSAPAPGYSRVFQSERLRTAIQRALPDIRLGLSGERACRVYPEVEQIEGARIVALARERLSAELAQQDAELELIGDVRAVSVPAGSESLTLRVRPGAAPTSGATLSVPVEVLVDGLVYRTVWTAWRIRRWETREVLARPVFAGQVLSAAHFERRRVSMTGPAASSLDARQVQGALALRDLTAGESVTESDVRRPRVVAMGANLFLEVRRGAIEARVPAVALAPGAVGDRIRVRTLGGGQELTATVKSSDLCRIDLGGK